MRHSSDDSGYLTTTVHEGMFTCTRGCYGIKNYCIEVPEKGFNSVPNFMKIYYAVQKLSVWVTQTDDLISLLSFLQSRLKKSKAVASLISF
jgi:hypothetical protein